MQKQNSNSSDSTPKPSGSQLGIYTVCCKIDATVACTLTHHLAQCAAQQPAYPGNLDICSLCIELCPGGSMHAGFIFLADSSHALIVGFCVRLTAQSVGCNFGAVLVAGQPTL